MKHLPILNPQQAAEYRQQGFIVVRGFLQKPELAELEERLGEFIASDLPDLPREHVFLEDKSRPETLKQIQQLGWHSNWFAELVQPGPIRQVAEEILEGSVVAKNVQYFNKPPRIGKPTPAHQDGYYFMITPCKAATLWLALDPVDDENGCVRYAAGSHHQAMREHARTETLGFSQGIVDHPTVEDRKTEVAIHAAPGDLLVHDAMTVHWADGNSSSRNRRALGFIFYSALAQEDHAAKEAYQQRLTKEMQQRGQI